MIYALVILYLLGAVLGASASLEILETSIKQSIIAAIFWPIVAIVAAAGMLAGYIEYKKEKK